MKERRSPLLTGSQTVRSIRDTGYKSTDYALAELIDNAVQECAETVLVVLVTEELKGKKRLTRRVVEIDVIDDGDGMTEDVASLCLAFGGSDRYDDRHGIGRFGMGLPAASVSQAKRVDVWSWQETQPGNAIHTYLDLMEIEADRSGELFVPYPTQLGESGHLELPGWIPNLIDVHATRSKVKGGVEVRSGTAVQWTHLDRLRWVRSEAIKSHTERLLGRIYRMFLTGAAVPTRRIRLGIVDKVALSGQGVSAIDFSDVRPNDPMYLMRPDESTLEYWDRQLSDGKTEKVTDYPVFEVFPKNRAEPETFKVTHEVDGQIVHGEVKVRASMARRDGRPGKVAGATSNQGRDAAQNEGVSVIRAGREIVLEQTLATEATDRWWGIEVAFEPVLDEVFGVTNSKQEVPYFTQALQLVQRFEKLSRDQAVDEGLFDDDHPLADLYDIAQRVLNLARSMKQVGREDRSAVKANTSQTQPSVTAGISKAKNAGDLPRSSEAEEFVAANPTARGQAETLRTLLKQKHPTLLDAEIDAILDLRDRQFTVQVLTESQPDNDAFFWPETSGDLEILNLNNASPAYRYLLDPLRLTDEQIRTLPEAELRERLGRGADALAMLLLMWLQMEIGNQADAPTQEKIREVRKRWGQAIRSGLGAVLSPDDLLAASGLDDEDE